jgi:hypothetical protein
MSRVHRFITQYRRSDDSLVRDYRLPSVRLDKLRRVFGASEDDPMAYSVPVTEQEREFVEGQIKRRLNMRDFEYFLESYAAPRPTGSSAVNGRVTATPAVRRRSSRGHVRTTPSRGR